MQDCVMMACLVCKTRYPIADEIAHMADTLVCDECNENLEGVFTPGQATMYNTIDRNYVLAMPWADANVDSQRVQKRDFHNMSQDNFHILCHCPRDEKRFIVGEGQHEH